MKRKKNIKIEMWTGEQCFIFYLNVGDSDSDT